MSKEVLKSYSTIRAICERYDRSKPTVYRLLQAGCFKAKKAGKSTLIDDQSAAEYFDNLPDYVSKAS